MVRPSSIDTIIEQFNKNTPDILIPTYQHKKGHPPIIHQRLKTKVLDLSRDLGLNSLFIGHPPQTLEIDDAGIIKSFNTPQEFEKLLTSKQ